MMREKTGRQREIEKESSVKREGEEERESK